MGKGQRFLSVRTLSKKQGDSLDHTWNVWATGGGLASGKRRPYNSGGSWCGGKKGAPSLHRPSRRIDQCSSAFGRFLSVRLRRFARFTLGSQEILLIVVDAGPEADPGAGFVKAGPFGKAIIFNNPAAPSLPTVVFRGDPSFRQPQCTLLWARPVPHHAQIVAAAPLRLADPRGPTLCNSWLV